MIVFKHFFRKKIAKMKRYWLTFWIIEKWKNCSRLWIQINFVFIYKLSSDLGLGTKRVLVSKPVREKEWRGTHRIATSMERWFSDAKKDLWKYHWNCATKAPETKYSIKKCNSNGKRVAIWRLAMGVSCGAVRKRFGIEKSAAVSITHDIYIKTFLEFLEDLYVFRNQEGKLAVQSGTLKKRPIPQGLGAIDCPHIKRLPPVNEDKKDYFSRKQCHTINTQAVIGANLKILDLTTGFAGSIHDARALRKTSIYRKAENNEIFSHPLRQINDVNVRPLILGDGTYPLFPWLVKPYPQGPTL